jgi:hypothetical protein
MMLALRGKMVAVLFADYIFEQNRMAFDLAARENGKDREKLQMVGSKRRREIDSCLRNRRAAWAKELSFPFRSTYTEGPSLPRRLCHIPPDKLSASARFAHIIQCLGL